VGVYLGHSAQHASSVALILNPKTGFVSPQFHCVFDDQFDSPKTDKNFSNVWAEMAGLLDGTRVTQEDNGEEIKKYLRQPIPHNMHYSFEPETPATTTDDVPNSSNAQIPNDDEPPTPETEGAQLQQETTRFSTRGRQIKTTQRLQESPLLPILKSFVSIATHVAITLSQLEDNSINGLCQLFAYSASIADTDTMYLHQALRQPDKDEFLAAMVKEIEDHTSRGHWRITTKAEMKQRGYDHKPIAAIWSFKRKRNPLGEITKYKARLCCHGGQTVKGVHYDETFSPVVAWSTVRLLLTLSHVYGWHARQIDFILLSHRQMSKQMSTCRYQKNLLSTPRRDSN
jgi:hypothetical protein